LVFNVTDNATNAKNVCVLLCRSVSENSTSGTNTTTLERTHYELLPAEGIVVVECIWMSLLLRYTEINRTNVQDIVWCNITTDNRMCLPVHSSE